MNNWDLEELRLLYSELEDSIGSGSIILRSDTAEWAEPVVYICELRDLIIHILERSIK